MKLMRLKPIESEKGAYNKLISLLLRFIADKGHAFSQAFRLLNVNRYYFNIRITISAIEKYKHID